MRVDEGSATISDKRGKLLFYTDGEKIRTREHEIMKNGEGLFGHTSSTQNTVIIPLPGSNDIYYVFTVDAAGYGHGLNYSIVDMSKDSGRGQVVQKNIFMMHDVYEKITAVKACNKRDIWIAVRKFETDEYYTFLLSNSGLYGPNVSKTGLIINGSVNNTIGAMKFSNDGTKLAAAHGYEFDVIELLDFDNISGRFFNPRVFRTNSSVPAAQIPGVYGVEFSPSNKFLYVTSKDNDATSYLYQFNVSLTTPSQIVGSKKLIAIRPDEALSGMQLGIDRKIYISKWNASYMSVINDPDINGTGCNFQNDVIKLGELRKNGCYGDLPSFIQSYFNDNAIAYDFTRSGSCTDRQVTFQLNKTYGIDSIKWNFGDNNFSTSLNPTHTYNSPGIYNVSAIVYKQDCSGVNDTAFNRIWVAASNSFLGKDTAFCNIKILHLGYSVTDASYLWNTGSTISGISVDTAGLFWLEIEQNGCTLRDSINVDVKPFPVVNLGADTGLCIGYTMQLDAKNAGAQYLWNTGATTQSIQINTKGVYSVTVSVNGCIAKGQIKILTGSCTLLIPTAFTPNGDGLNDSFGVLNEYGLNDFDMKIFDRWGKVVFRSNSLSKKWNGKFKNENLPDGVYLWTVSYTNTAQQRVKEKGTITLLR